MYRLALKNTFPRDTRITLLVIGKKVYGRRILIDFKVILSENYQFYEKDTDAASEIQFEQVTSATAPLKRDQRRISYGLDDRLAHCLSFEILEFLIIPAEKYHLRISFVGQNVGTNSVKKVPVVARHALITTRNQSAIYLTTMAQPANSINASSNERMVSTSRSLVGSKPMKIVYKMPIQLSPSRRRTLAPDFTTFANWHLLRSPPERAETFFC